MAEGKYITFEGISGSGKTTQIALTYQWFKDTGRPALVMKEPGPNEFGQRIRELALARDDLDSLTEAFLFEADRSYSFHQSVLPALKEGIWVLSDRGPDGTEVFQTIIGAANTDLVRSMTAAATEGKLPDRTILLDIPPRVAYERFLSRGTHDDKFDERGSSFFAEMHRAYEELADRYPARIVKVNGVRALQEIQLDVRKIIEQLL